jgi:hypothetical protein
VTRLEGGHGLWHGGSASLVMGRGNVVVGPMLRGTNASCEIHFVRSPVGGAMTAGYVVSVRSVCEVTA